jgi:hypothetical protein
MLNHLYAILKSSFTVPVRVNLRPMRVTLDQVLEPPTMATTSATSDRNPMQRLPATRVLNPYQSYRKLAVF